MTSEYEITISFIIFHSIPITIKQEHVCVFLHHLQDRSAPVRPLPQDRIDMLDNVITVYGTEMIVKQE